MALVISSLSGSILLPKRLTTSPLRLIRNFSKFHLIGPEKLGLVSLSVRNLYRGQISRTTVPSLSFIVLTQTLESMGNVTLYLLVQKSLISASVPGSWAPNSLAG